MMAMMKPVCDAVNAVSVLSHGYYQHFNGTVSFSRVMNYGDNYTSVSDCGHFLKEIYQSNAGTADIHTCAYRCNVFASQNAASARNKIPANLPEGVKVANKTGELD